MDEAARKILDVTPTTIAGVQALLRYAVETDIADVDGHAWPDELEDATAVTQRTDDHTWWFFMARNCASALAKIEAANQLG